MLDVRKVSKSFIDKQVLEDVSFNLDNEVVALVGDNGAGKTTLFKIILGELTPDSGSISKNNESIGYLPQQTDFGALTVNQFLHSLVGNEKQGYEMERVLHQLNLAHIDRHQQASSLSGGEKTKLYLASLLLAEPEPTLLLLDEPTNNLDLDGIYWLEEFISRYKGSILLTSHDRAFLDEVVDRIIELEKGQVKIYGGNYSFYREQKLEREKAYLKKYKENVAEIERLERLIVEKKEKAKQLSKDKGRDNDKYARYFFSQKSAKFDRTAKAFESRLKRIKRMEKPLDRRTYPFTFQGEVHSDKFILGVKNLSKRYRDKQVLNDISFSVTGNNHVWLSGKNGSGKSTILNIIVGKDNPNSGSVEIGHGVKVGYFSQELLPPSNSKTVIEELKELGANETDCYRFAIFLHLTKEDIIKHVTALSRGQRTKLEFIKLLMAQNHVLILDEPTNHLEIDTREQIEEALQYYDGAILVVSHDRYFLEKIGIDAEIRLTDGEIWKL